jgi:hypothetical protein
MMAARAARDADLTSSGPDAIASEEISSGTLVTHATKLVTHATSSPDSITKEETPSGKLATHGTSLPDVITSEEISSGKLVTHGTKLVTHATSSPDSITKEENALRESRNARNEVTGLDHEGTRSEFEADTTRGVRARALSASRFALSRLRKQNLCVLRVLCGSASPYPTSIAVSAPSADRAMFAVHAEGEDARGVLLR